MNTNKKTNKLTVKSLVTAVSAFCIMASTNAFAVNKPGESGSGGGKETKRLSEVIKNSQAFKSREEYRKAQDDLKSAFSTARIEISGKESEVNRIAAWAAVTGKDLSGLNTLLTSGKASLNSIGTRTLELLLAMESKNMLEIIVTEVNGKQQSVESALYTEITVDGKTARYDLSDAVFTGIMAIKDDTAATSAGVFLDKVRQLVDKNYSARESFEEAAKTLNAKEGEGLAKLASLCGKSLSGILKFL